MTDVEAPPAAVGTKVLGSYQFDGGTAWLAPGHNSVLTQKGPDGSDEYFVVHHVRFAAEPSQHVVQVRRLFFTAAGWPVVSPQPFAGLRSEAVPAPAEVAGTWQVLRFDPESTDIAPAVRMNLKCVEPCHAEFRGRPELDAVVFSSWDWSCNRPALSFSGIDQHGVAWSGTREGLL
jgi:arabinan endo-1,5-alpha-L-arabinosidase